MITITLKEYNRLLADRTRLRLLQGKKPTKPVALSFSQLTELATGTLVYSYCEGTPYTDTLIGTTEDSEEFTVPCVVVNHTGSITELPFRDSVWFLTLEELTIYTNTLGEI